MKRLLCLSIITHVILLAVTKEYHVPKPNIRVLSSRGFQVSIPHSKGIHLFSFHGNINRPMGGFEAGQFSEDIFIRKKNKWVFVDRDTELKPGDVIYYWVFVAKNGLGYIYNNGEFVVEAFSPTSTKFYSHHYPPRDSTGTEPKKTPEIDVSCRCPLHHYFVDEIEDLTAKVEQLREHSRLLQELLEKSQFSSLEMKFEGILPAYEDAAYSAQVIIDVKLGLKVPVVNATRTADNNITFRLANLDDKLTVIKVAKDKLIESKIKLIY